MRKKNFKFSTTIEIKTRKFFGIILRVFALATVIGCACIEDD